MSAIYGSLPGEGITLRILRDDGVTYAGVTRTTPNLQRLLALATGLSAAEQARALNAVSAQAYSPRQPFRQGFGWGLYLLPASIQIYILRDDGSHLSYQAPQEIFSVQTAAAALLATSGLSINEQAIINNFAGSSASAAIPSFPAQVRPTTFSIARAGNAWGDSTTFGVSAPAGFDLVSCMRLGVTSGPTSQAFHLLGTATTVTANYYGNGGLSGANSTTILGNITYCNTNFNSEMNRTHFISWGLNDYNTGVAGWARDWPAQVKANYASALALVPGGFDCFFNLAPPESNFAPGTNVAADYAFHRRDMLASYGRRANFYARTLRLQRELSLPTGTADAFAISFGSIPYSDRGIQGGTDYPDVDPVVTLQASNPTGGSNTGALTWNTATGMMWRDGSAGFTLSETKHQGRVGDTRFALIDRDLQAASEASGPPHVPPIEFRCAIDATLGTIVGQLVYTGTPTAFALGNLDGSLNTLFAISSTGQVTRSATGTLTDGVITLVVAVSNTNGTLYSAVDVYVVRSASVTAPVMRTFSQGLSVASRWAHGMADGTAVSWAMWVQFAAFDTQRTLFTLTRATNTPMTLLILANGNLRVTASNNAGTASTITSTGLSMGTNTGRWIFGNLDATAGTSQIYVGDTAATLSGALSTGTFALSDCNPVFLAQAPANQFNEPGTPHLGGCGFLMLADGQIDWSTQANRRVLMDASGNPVSRTPYGAIAGVTPKLEEWGAKGDWLYGTPDGSNGPQTMSLDWRAISRMA